MIFRSRKTLENQLNLGSDRTEVLEVQLKEARALAAESDRKYDEVSCLIWYFISKKTIFLSFKVARKLLVQENELEKAEERAKRSEA